VTSLYLLEQGSQVSKKGNQLLVLRQDGQAQEIPFPLIERILIFGRSHLTLDVTRGCLLRQVTVAYLSRSGWLYGSLSPLTRGRGRQWQLQKQRIESPSSLEIARVLVAAKVHNQRVLLQRLSRRRTGVDLTLILNILLYLLSKIGAASDLATLRGYEGAAAAQYFPALGQLIVNPAFTLTQRIKRPPTNPMNALLGFCYSVFWNHLRGVIELYALDPYLGHLHEENPKHLALVSDLIEPFRPALLDSLVITLVNNRILSLEAFEYRDGGCYLNDQGRRLVLAEFERKMSEKVQITPTQEGHRWELVDYYVRAYIRHLHHPEVPLDVYRVR